jgi:hypothetical protein
LRACSRDDPECGARRGVSLLPLVPAKAGTQLLDSRLRGNERRGKPRWSAERRASRVMGRKAPRKRLACRVISAFTRVFDARWRAPRVFRRAPERFSALRPPLSPGERSKGANPGRKNASRERDGLFDIVSCLKLDAHPHPEERACQRPAPHSSARARVSKGEGGHGMQPSCFETHRNARPLWKHLRSRRAAMLLSMRARHVLGERSQRSFGRTTPRGKTNLRLWETIAGSVPLFPACY